jgi:hypothetical protein
VALVLLRGPERADSASKSAQILLTSLLLMPLFSTQRQTRATEGCVRSRISVNAENPTDGRRCSRKVGIGRTRQ